MAKLQRRHEADVSTMTDTRIWKTAGFVEDDPWRLIDADTPLEDEIDRRPVLTVERYLDLPEETRRSGRIGVQLSPADDPALLAPYVADLPLIAVSFPAFNDGRAYSQASLLRSRYGFGGELRAVGDVLIDQVPLMLRCGIDSFAVSNPVALRRLAEGRLPGINSHYQPAAVPSQPEGKLSWRHIAQ